MIAALTEVYPFMDGAVEPAPVALSAALQRLGVRSCIGPWAAGWCARKAAWVKKYRRRRPIIALAHDHRVLVTDEADGNGFIRTRGKGHATRLAEHLLKVVQADPQGTDAPPGNLTVRCTMCVPGTPDPSVDCP